MARRSTARRASQALQRPVWPLIAPWLPADARACCACVSKGLREVMCDQSLAVHLDMSVWSGVSCAVNDATVVAAAAVAGGQLETLDVRGRELHADVLATVAAANAATLRELYVGGEGIEFTAEELRDLFAAAPQLLALEADVVGNAHDAKDMLTGTPPFGALRVRHICVIKSMPRAGQYVEDVLSRFFGRLNSAIPVDRTTQELAAALRSNRYVEEVELEVDMSQRGSKLVNTAALLLCLTDHPTVHSLRVVGVGWEDMSGERGGPTAFGVYPALTSLLASDTLGYLSLPYSDNLNAALGALVGALPTTTRLHTLHASGANLSPVFVTEQLLPALSANTSLLELQLEPIDDDVLPPEAQQAMDLIAQRSQE
jgi:hypothetical protein